LPEVRTWNDHKPCENIGLLSLEELWFGVQMSSFMTKKLDESDGMPDTLRMATRATKSRSHRQVASQVRQRIQAGGERLWTLEDFPDLPFSAVAQALSRLTRAGAVDRLSKGVYYRPRQTPFGKSRPHPAAMRELALRRKNFFPSGTLAANFLGFTTQNPSRGELATDAASLPRKLIGEDTVVHSRRPPSWSKLSEHDAAMLDFLRQAGRSSELSPEATTRRLLKLLSEQRRFERLLEVADTEPPRVRAMLGAIGQQIGACPKALERLRQSLNPLSRFDFGMLTELQHARQWQAKERPRREAV